MVAWQGRVRWYNPRLGGFEWREVPHSDEEVLAMLDGCPGGELCAEVYGEWRQLGASMEAALIRAGEKAREKDAG